ncbi:hypothetical protein L3X07_01245 [Levilactobacillus brevis]|nr:hypothetical protein [Levilactobacillus brevis]
MEITKSAAGTLNQQDISKYVLTNQQGTQVAVLTWVLRKNLVWWRMASVIH